MCFLDSVYKTLIISTIVDATMLWVLKKVYKTLIISTIVDLMSAARSAALSIRHL